MPAEDTTPLSLPIIGDIDVLSRAEQANIRDPLFEALTAVWKATDDLIGQTNKRRQEAMIWQTIDSEDTYFLVDCIVGAGARVAVVAGAVRGIVESYKKFRIGAILLPRFLMSVNFYAENGGLALPWFG